MSSLTPRIDNMEYSYVGTNPEASGGSPYQLLSTHKRIQCINPAGDIIVKLPTTGILAGETFKIVNRSTNSVTVQSSGANQIDIIAQGYIIVTALIDTPAAAADWKVEDVSEEYTFTTTLAYIAASPPSYTLKLVRHNKAVTFRSTTYISVSGKTSVNDPLSADYIPARFRPVTSAIYISLWSMDNTVDRISTLYLNTGGQLQFAKSPFVPNTWLTSGTFRIYEFTGCYTV